MSYKLTLTFHVEYEEAGLMAQPVKSIVEIVTLSDSASGPQMKKAMHHMMLRVGARLAEVEKPKIIVPKGNRFVIR